MKYLLSAILTIVGIQTHAESAKKILIVLSSEQKLTLKHGIFHPTGFFLSELAVPLQSLISAGYQPIFSTPKGNPPVMDQLSDSAIWFGGDEQKYLSAKSLILTQTGLTTPLNLAEVSQSDLSQYSGVFIPGGHAPMEDLSSDINLGIILRYFHKAKKPTALICHGPIALLSVLPNAQEYLVAISKNKTTTAQAWIYSGYVMTFFSTPEERQEEPGQDNALGGFVNFYPDFALQNAGGIIKIAPKWQSHVVRDRELITGQNPMSDNEFTQVLLNALNEKK